MKPGLYFILDKSGLHIGEAVYKSGVLCDVLFYKNPSSSIKYSINIVQKKFKLRWSCYV